MGRDTRPERKGERVMNPMHHAEASALATQLADKAADSVSTDIDARDDFDRFIAASHAISHAAIARSASSIATALHDIAEHLHATTTSDKRTVRF
ncbi:hypothetical protein [Mycobacterium sp. C31M]